MEKWKKIVIILAVIIILVLLVWLIVRNSHEVGANDTSEGNIAENINEENVTNVIENGTENQSNIANEVESSVNQTTGVNNESNASQKQEPEGKEEVESNEENQGINQEDKAIEMAKAAWGLSTDAYTFAIDLKQGDIYRVSVISNAIVIAYYDVNVKTGEVTEN